MKSSDTSKKIYFRIWIALMLLLALTWGLAEINLGPFNNVAALGISAAKTLLVVMFFMHVRHESKLTWVFVAAGLIWLLIMVDLTMSDYVTRGDVPGKRESWRHSQQPLPSTGTSTNIDALK
ncbi:MAG TPA: cytochrome C oxidase subunit IV family protein [Candidatus Polarisedimenticolia bacterium]|nr:cytochrome C oxidase subunit IV family protein [Candidatus Polarisedimenticolia bacterium]